MVRFSSLFFSESLSKNPSKSVIVVICFSLYIKYVFESIQVNENQLLSAEEYSDTSLNLNHKIKNLTKLSNSIIYKNHWRIKMCQITLK